MARDRVAGMTSPLVRAGRAMWAYYELYACFHGCCEGWKLYFAKARHIVWDHRGGEMGVCAVSP